jgi:hypothetical protein
MLVSITYTYTVPRNTGDQCNWYINTFYEHANDIVHDIVIDHLQYLQHMYNETMLYLHNMILYSDT